MKPILYTLLISICPLLTLAQVSPIDFEDNGIGQDWTWTCFENDSNPPLEIVDNPDPSGINTSAKVAKFTALKAGNPWAGCESKHGEDIGTFDITAANSQIRIMVYKSVISDVGIKLVTSTSASLGEIKIANTKVNEWEQLTFDFSSHIGGMTYDQIVIFPDFDTRDSTNVIYFDNVYGDSAGQNASITKPDVVDLTIYPNPNSGLFKVNSDKALDRIEIITMDGRVVYQEHTPQSNCSIDLSAYSNGLYTLKAYMGEGVHVRRFALSTSH